MCVAFLSLTFQSGVLIVATADGGTFNDEKEGIKVPFELGTVAMANSGKNCTSPSLSSSFISSLSSLAANTSQVRLLLLALHLRSDSSPIRSSSSPSPLTLPS